MNKNSKMVKARHPSLEMPDNEVVVKKKQDMLTKARNKLINISEALKATKAIENEHHKKTVAQATLDYLFKHCPKDKNHVYANTNVHTKKKNSLQKQNSVGAYPIKIEITNDSDTEEAIRRSRPATVCVDKLCEGRETAALALERPRKKLSFREPEIMDRTLKHHNRKHGNKNPEVVELKRSASYCNGILHRSPSFDDSDLESQAMRVVRTIGQAFEVCHKLSINAPENENLDQDEQDTLTQDLLSDRLSDITSDKPKKDLLSEGASDKMSLPPDDACSYPDTKAPKPQQLEILPPPPTNNTRKSPLTSAETYSSPHSDILTSGSGSGCSNSLPPPGSALSAHHEIQLLREQLEQQSQQTQAAMAQLQLAREQLAAEQSARLEAQARTHQLLIHNRELLDHIAALVAHLQGGEKTAQQQTTPPHVPMPQQQQPGPGDNYDHLSDTAPLDNNPTLQALGLNPQGLIENRAVTSCLPQSPLRTTYNPQGGVFNFSYPPPMDTTYDPQLLQRLQNLSGYPPPNYAYNYPQALPFMPNLYSQPLLNNNYTLPSPTQKKMPSSPMTLRHSFGGSSPGSERRISPGRSSDPQYSPTQSNQLQNPQCNHLQVQSNSQSNHLQIQQNVNSRQPSPERRDSQCQFIKPLPQMGTLTTTDSEGRVRVIVPVPSNSADETGNIFANLRLSDSLRVNDDLRTLNGGPITRSTSEKVPNRSELMSQVQRTMWARHTTK